MMKVEKPIFLTKIPMMKVEKPIFLTKIPIMKVEKAIVFENDTLVASHVGDRFCF